MTVDRDRAGLAKGVRVRRCMRTARSQQQDTHDERAEASHCGVEILE